MKYDDELFLLLLVVFVILGGALLLALLFSIGARACAGRAKQLCPRGMLDLCAPRPALRLGRSQNRRGLEPALRGPAPPERESAQTLPHMLPRSGIND
jgi:hypothetical protein